MQLDVTRIMSRVTCPALQRRASLPNSIGLDGASSALQAWHAHVALLPMSSAGQKGGLQPPMQCLNK